MVELPPHLHLLAAEGMWSDGLFAELPPPTPEEVEAVLARALRQLLADFEPREVVWPQDEYEALQAKSPSSSCRSTTRRRPPDAAASRC
jgi:hypothetical protein